MSKTTFEKLGIPYVKRNGIFIRYLWQEQSRQILMQESMGACGLSI